MENILRFGCHRLFLFGVFFLFTSTNPLRGQWIQAGLTNSSIRSFVVIDTFLFAGTHGEGVFLSTNNGTSWTPVNSGLTGLNVWCLAVSYISGFTGTNLFAGTDNGVFRSTNYGTNWTAVNQGLADTLVRSLAVNYAFAPTGTADLFAGTVDSGVFRSSDNGSTWIAARSGMGNANVWSLALSDTNLFAGTYQNGVFRSTNNGVTWTAVNSGLTNTNIYGVYSLAVLGLKIFAGLSGQGVFLSTNIGASWTKAGSDLALMGVSCLGVSGTNLFAGTLGDGVFFSTNNGTNWTAANAGLTNTRLRTLTVYGTNLFAGTDSGVSRRPLSEMLTSVEKPSTGVPASFSLAQSYPNPFNSLTTISFTISSQSFVSLKVFDALGREVSVLLSEELPAGMYRQQWNAGGSPTGVYFYRIQAGSFIETKKLVLLR